MRLLLLHVLALAMACLQFSSSDDPPMAMDDPPPPVGDGGPGPVLTELQMAQADAAAAATAAMTASGNAATAAAAAATAVANLATMQTNATAGGLAYEAHTAAGDAMAAYTDAKAASEEAAAAEDVTTAVTAKLAAEMAMADAVKYAGIASEKGTAAETAAMAALMIEGKDKSVGGTTSVNADADSSVVTTATGTTSQTVETGRIKTKDPKHEDFGVVVTGNVHRAGVDLILGTADDVAYKQAVAARDITIGRTLDTSNDMARLMLVTHYAGTKMVRVYKDEGTTRQGMKAGYITIEDNDTPEDEANNVKLTSKGTYYPVDGMDGDLVPADEVPMTAMPKEVFSYTDPTKVTDTDDGTRYVVAGTTVTGGATPVYNYIRVDVDTDNAAVDEEDMLTASKVRAALPVAIDYKHIHFGVWVALGAAEKERFAGTLRSRHWLRPELLGRWVDRRRYAEQRQSHVQWQLGCRCAGGGRGRQRRHFAATRSRGLGGGLDQGHD